MFIRQEAIQIKELKNELKQCTDWIDFYQNNNDKNLISRMQKELDQVILKSKQARKQL
jgi:thiaminase